jgi:hypothetical protein
LRVVRAFEARLLKHATQKWCAIPLVSDRAQGSSPPQRNDLAVGAARKPAWRRRSESRPVRRSESDPPEGGSFYVLLI